MKGKKLNVTIAGPEKDQQEGKVYLGNQHRGENTNVRASGEEEAQLRTMKKTDAEGRARNIGGQTARIARAEQGRTERRLVHCERAGGGKRVLLSATGKRWSPSPGDSAKMLSAQKSKDVDSAGQMGDGKVA